MSIQLTVMSLDFETNVAPSTTTYTKKEISLGRGPDNDVILNLPEVSGRHAILIAKHDDSGEPMLFIKDLGSSNGTLVENNYIDSDIETPLQPNQRIKIGRFLIKPFLNIEDFDSLEEVSENGTYSDEDSDTDPTTEVFFSKSSHDEEQESKTAPMSEPTYIMHKSDLEAVDAGMNGSHEHGDDNNAEIALGHDDTNEEDSALDDDTLTASDLDENESGAFSHFGSSHEDSSNFESVTLPTTKDIDYGSVEGSLDDTDATDVDFIALELFSVSGKVVHKGSPVEGVKVSCKTLGSATTDSNGEFSFNNVAETTDFSISLDKNRYRFSADGLDGSVGSNIDIKVDAQKLFSISGRVVHRGEALSGVEIDGGELGKTLTDANGYYEFSDVPEDTEYSIRAMKDGFVFGTRKVKR
ncbi:MAG: FHA domain-containing protein [Bdellovibrionales bacterium]|nr:FHA domain-containing protein [Bdellovibrionales bacterium]